MKQNFSRLFYAAYSKDDPKCSIIMLVSIFQMWLGPFKQPIFLAALNQPLIFKPSNKWRFHLRRSQHNHLQSRRKYQIRSAKCFLTIQTKWLFSPTKKYLHIPEIIWKPVYVKISTIGLFTSFKKKKCSSWKLAMNQVRWLILPHNYTLSIVLSSHSSRKQSKLKTMEAPT